MSKKKKLLVINHGFILGGVETFITKIFPKLTYEYDVYLLLSSKSINTKLLNQLPGSINIIFFKDNFSFLKDIFQKKIKLDIIFSTLPQCFIYSLFIFIISKNKNLKIIVSPHQTESFCSKYNLLQIHRFVTRFSFKLLPLNNIIFLNKASKSFHESRLNYNFTQSPVIPLYVDAEKFPFFDRSKIKRNKVLSVGRLASYKTYNLELIPIFQKLYNEGVDIEWHIYGEGELKKEMVKKITQKNNSNIFIHDSVDYDLLCQTMNDYFLFIGSGTTLLEASSTGLPSLTTIEDLNKPQTYGLVCDISGNCFIEPNLNLKKFNIYNYIKKIKDCDVKSYINIQKKSRKKALEFSKDVIEDYRKVLSSADKLKAKSFLLIIVCFIYILFAALNKLMRVFLWR